MIRAVFLSCILLMTICLKGQTITKEPIFKSAYQRLTIKELDTGGIVFLYQNPEYQTVVDIISFSVDSKQQAIDLLKEGLKILEMPKTSKDVHIEHNFAGVGIKRFGFSQKAIYFNDLNLNKNFINKIIAALEKY